MKKYIKQYRVVGEFDYDGNLAYSDIMEDCGNFVYCDNGFVRISRYGEDALRVDVKGGGRLKRIYSQINEAKIKVILYDILDREGIIVVEEKNTTKLFKLCKAKRQRNIPISVINVKDNVKYFERSMQRFNNYQDSEES